jgi:HlyD family secretion protein
MVVSDLSAIEIEAEVDETDIASIQLGQGVEILLDAFPDTTFRGEVIQVGNSAKASSFAVTDQVTNFLVKILILDKVKNIKPGMTASVDITTDYRENAIKVSAGAVVMRPEDTGKEKENTAPKEGGDSETDTESEDFEDKQKEDIDGVFLCSEGKAKFTAVTTGIRDQQYVEITSGLSEGDSVVTGSYRTLRTLKHDEILDPQKPKFGPGAEGGENSE